MPGLHRVSRGAEIAFMSVGSELARRGHEVTLIGSGPERPGTSYRYLSAPLIGRERFERFPSWPAFRTETSWEEASFIPGFLRVYRPADYDVTLACSYPFLNWALRSRKHKGRRPAHVFVTQNGDWPAQADNSENRFFGCEGLVCINPDYLETNRDRYRSALIPNGVDLARFHNMPPARADLGLPEGVPLVLMASALIHSKQVGTAIDAVSRLPGVHLAVAGDGPLRATLRDQAARLMPGRFHNFTVTPDRMPALYNSADLFLHLSRDECFGNVFVEAMACGLTTVAWDLPRTRWITDTTACLVRDEDMDALTSGIADSLQRSADRSALEERAKLFSWDRIAAQYEAFLAEVIAQRG
ncbi:hypothetical protein GCM10022211_09120 [Sphingomonas humi]|uniref:Glycosyltransferase n=1 Tax=Sphingomonas humi TaxID=335630 RepID=A0ABP7RQM1_9SPHN